MGSFLDKLLLGIKQVWRNGVPMPQRPVINLIGFAAVLDNPSLGTTDVYSSTGGSGGGGLLIENNGVAMPIEPALNFVGFTLADNVPGQSTDVYGGSFGSPGAIISTSTTIGPADHWKRIQAVAGGYTLTVGLIQVGVPFHLTHVGGAAGTNLFETAGQAVTLSRGGNPFFICDPQDTLAAPATSVTLRTSRVTYHFCLDGASGVLRSLGMS